MFQDFTKLYAPSKCLEIIEKGFKDLADKKQFTHYVEIYTQREIVDFYNKHLSILGEIENEAELEELIIEYYHTYKRYMEWGEYEVYLEEAEIEHRADLEMDRRMEENYLI